MLDDLMDREEDYSHCLSKVHCGLQESQGGALASMRAMPAEEQRVQFQHLNQQFESMSQENKGIKEGMEHLTKLVSSLLLANPARELPSLHIPPNSSQSQCLITHFCPELSLTLLGVGKDTQPFYAPPPPSPYIPPSTSAVGNTSNQATSQQMAPPKESHSIPKVMTLQETIDQWEYPNPPGLPVALKNWKHEWYSGANRLVHGVKYGQRKRIGMEFSRYINHHFPFV